MQEEEQQQEKIQEKEQIDEVTKTNELLNNIHKTNVERLEENKAVRLSSVAKKVTPLKPLYNNRFTNLTEFSATGLFGFFVGILCSVLALNIVFSIIAIDKSKTKIETIKSKLEKENIANKDLTNRLKTTVKDFRVVKANLKTAEKELYKQKNKNKKIIEEFSSLSDDYKKLMEKYRNIEAVLFKKGIIKKRPTKLNKSTEPEKKVNLKHSDTEGNKKKVKWFKPWTWVKYRNRDKKNMKK